MELQLGLKITHTRDDISSHTDLRIDKNYAGPLFLSTETESMFFLVAYLKGFRIENIDIDINKDGDQIAISGKRAVQEMALSGWIMQRKDVELRAFRKVFRIPDGIVLDRIKAKFNDEESTLTIIMPKSVKGMRRLEIEEVKEEIERIEPEIQRTLPYEDDKEEAKEQDIDHKIERKEESDQAVDQGRTEAAKAEEPKTDSKQVIEENKPNEEEFKNPKETEKASPSPETRNEDLANSEEQQKEQKILTEGNLVESSTKSQHERAIENEIQEESQNQERREPELFQESHEGEIAESKDHRMKEVEAQEAVVAKKTDSRAVKKGCKIRPPPVFVGSALLVSLIVLAINLIRAKRR